MTKTPLEQALAATLGRPSDCSSPVDPVLLAEYLDGVLAAAERQPVEAHLAACPSCRELAAESGLALVSEGPWAVVPSSSSWWSRSWRGLGLAAIFLGAIVSVFFWSAVWSGADRSDPRLAPLGVEASVWMQLDEPARLDVVQALDGTLEPLTVFAGFIDAEQGSVLRTASGGSAPVPLAPRWSRVRQVRPTLRWGLHANDPPALISGEILVVDAAESRVETWPFSVPSDGSDGMNITLPWPDDIESLERGTVYAWKVNLLLDGEWLASDYVPFEVLREDDSSVRTNSFLTGAEALHLGLHDEVLASWSSLDVTADGESIRRQLLRSVLERQRLEEPWIDRELARWSRP